MQCRPVHLYVRALIMSLIIPYSRMQLARPRMLGQAVAHERQRAVHRGWLNPFWIKTTVAIALSDLPMPDIQLRLGFSPYLFNTQDKELILRVEDWVDLSRQLLDFRGRWQAQRRRRPHRNA
ncbi:MAG: hypothetical protein GX620_01410 [Chloroflexi bacterium]|nr:hypothetical protein [Chloroflexota bacterium]